ncbi:MAG: sigma 54-interacting transcriptional regulator [Bacteroidetes bacterium]|nr:sigma 54-interacting transcriptional regulator [Bacteroidota bacterium]
MDILTIKQRFGIIGNSSGLDRAIDIARQVAPTDITVLISGESGVGKESFPQIIHQLSARKHGPYIAVNCGAIPEGTIDSELFGHEKGSFTGALEARKGYFEVANGGTIFLDEVADLPLSTQVRLLRVLETGEFIKVGSSKMLKTDVRIVAASNIDIPNAIEEGKFRQDLYYRLNTVPIYVPPLRERKEDIILLFRKFAVDFAEKYRMPALDPDDDAKRILMDYRWMGNVRQLKNLVEQISIIEQNREITGPILRKYLPESANRDLPVIYNNHNSKGEFSEREIMYKVLFDMRKDINELKKLIVDIAGPDVLSSASHPAVSSFDQLYREYDQPQTESRQAVVHQPHDNSEEETFAHSEVLEESLSLQQKEMDMIKRALEKHLGKRRNAAKELGISERTLYRKIKEYNIKS